MNVTVIGAGTMGHGIAQVSAMAGHKTTLTDANESMLPSALARIEDNLDGAVKRKKLDEDARVQTLGKLNTNPSLDNAVEDADLVIEAIIEDLDIKRNLFHNLDSHTAESCILATNTSSLSVTEIANSTANPGRVIGLHFFNPVHIMKLVEIITHDRTDAATAEMARHFAESIGKTPISVKDSPGFASSRLGVVLGLEAMRMVEQGVASPEDIDKALELGYGHPMGPLRVSDLVGLDVRLAIAEYLHDELKEAHYAPPEILRNKVKAGELGKKTGKGFYEWPNKT